MIESQTVTLSLMIRSPYAPLLPCRFPFRSSMSLPAPFVTERKCRAMKGVGKRLEAKDTGAGFFRLLTFLCCYNSFLG